MGYLDANLSALESLLGHRPRLPEDDGRARVVCADSVPVLYLASSPSQPVALNSRRDPVAEALKAVDAALAGQAAPRVVAVVGLGLGFVIDAIEQRCPSAKIVALEPEPSCVRPLLERRDLTGLIAAGRLFLLWGPDYRGSVAACRFLDGDGEAVPTLIHPVLVRQTPEAVKAAGSVLQRMLVGGQANAEARRKFGPRYLLNTLRNLPALARSTDVRQLFDAFAGMPGLIVSAGPSLDRNLDEVRSVADRAILVAVDTALRPLLSAGIRPHLVVAVDPSDLNGQHLQNLPDTHGIHLVAEGSLDPAALAAFEGRTFTFRVSDHHPWPWLRTEGFDRGVLQAWGSVATTAFDLVLRLGCNPVAFVGQDLAFTDGRHHCLGTTFGSDLTPPTDNETTVQEIDVNGQPAVTTPTLVAFRDWLVEQCAHRPDRRFVNATGAGILVGGGIAQGSLSGTIAAPLAGVPQSVLTRLSQCGDAEASQVQTAAVRLVQAMEEDGVPATVAAWLDAAGRALSAEEVRSALSWLPGEGSYFARLVLAATRALSRVLALDQPASRLLPAPDAQSASDDVLARFEWAPAARADVEFLRCVLRIASSREAPDSKDTPAAPFRWSAPPSCRPAEEQLPDTGLPLSSEAAGWWARRALVLQWARLLHTLPGEDGRDPHSVAWNLADWLGKIATGPWPVAQDQCATELAVRMQQEEGTDCSFRLELNTPPWRLMRALTGALSRVPSDGTSPSGRADVREGLTCFPIHLPVGHARSGRLSCSLDARPAVLAGTRDPRTRFMCQAEAWVEPRVVALPSSFLCGSLDAATALVTPYAQRHSWRIDAEGVLTRLPAWPYEIVGEQRGPGTSDGIAWANRDAWYIMRRRSSDGSVNVAATPFRPARGIVARDGRSYWAATTGGLWCWDDDGRLHCVVSTPPLGSVTETDEGFLIDPTGVDVEGRQPRILLQRGWMLRTSTGELCERELGELGQSCRRTECGEWWATAHPAADVIRIGRGEAALADLACERPSDIAWAGTSLVCATGYGIVLLFPDVSTRLPVNRPGECSHA